MFTNKIFGLDISDQSIEALELAEDWRGNYKIKGYKRSAVAAGIAERGFILQEDKLVQIIKKMLKDAKPNPIDSKNLALSFPESQILTSIITLPASIKRDNLKEVIQNQIPEVFPYNLDDIHFAWQELNANESTMEILVAVVNNKLYNQYLSLAQKINCKIVSLELESASCARAMVNEIKNDEGVLILDIGSRSTNITIFNNDGLFSTYTANIAGQNFTEKIAQKKSISISEAEKIKIQSGLSAKNEEGELLLIIQSELQKIIPEIKKSLDYFNKKTQKEIKRGYLSGGSSLLANLPKYLSNNLHINLGIGDPFTKIKNCDIVMSAKEKILFANVIGLALRGIEKKTFDKEINFINKN